MKSTFRTIEHQVDFCVVGGGMAGVVAALSAARHGAKVLLMHDRPVLGGNASSECRVHICGADRHNQVKNMRETGILEELRLENLFHNPNRNFSVWDTILYEKAMAEPNLTLLLNCTCQSAMMKNSRSQDETGSSMKSRIGNRGSAIESITGWQLTTQTYHTVFAKIFADCSGDAVLAPLTGADFQMGRGGRDEFGESIAPEIADQRTMGMTCLFQSREYGTPQAYTPPAWAHSYISCAELPYGEKGHRWWQMGYWWVELGGEYNSIHDTEVLRDELLKITFGVWDHIKNHCPHKNDAVNWALDWVQFLPAKRESRRYLGDHILTQIDIENGGHFNDLVAYGGWTMDDHHPAGFQAVRISAPATIFHHSPSPYGIPYRCFYSRNIENLMFAGRDISATHAAMSSTRVMGTCSSIAQAVGTAVALAVQKGIIPADVNNHIEELQQALLSDDAYLPWVTQKYTKLTKEAVLISSHGNPEPIRDGINRPVGRDPHAWVAGVGDWVEYRFAATTFVRSGTLILDSALDRCIQLSYHQNDDQLHSPPDVMPKKFTLDGWFDGGWQTIFNIANNYQRLVRIPVDREVQGLRWTLDETWGAPQSKVFAFYLD